MLEYSNTNQLINRINAKYNNSNVHSLKVLNLGGVFYRGVLAFQFIPKLTFNRLKNGAHKCSQNIGVVVIIQSGVKKWIQCGDSFGWKSFSQTLENFNY